MPDESQEPRIFVDSDWKQQAQREKEELDRQTRQAEREQGPAEVSILEIAHILVMQAVAGLGGLQDAQTGRPIPPNLPVARHFIDLLGILLEKTRPNLTDEERRSIEGTLNELRMAFVQIVEQLETGASAPPPGAGA